MPQKTFIFICYRREDSSGHMGRLLDRLTERFGDEQVFTDIDQIEPGRDFVEVIENVVGSCWLMLVIIGRQWLNIREPKGRGGSTTRTTTCGWRSKPPSSGTS